MAKLIDNAIAEELLDITDALDIIENAFSQLGRGDAAFYPRTDIVSPTAVDGDCYCWGSLLGAIRDPPRLAFRFKSDVLVWDKEDGMVNERKFNVEPGIFMGFVFLFDTTTGELVGLFNDGVVQHIRVGATAGVACKYLAAEDATRMGVLGSGGMARTYAKAFAQVRDIERISVYSPTRRHREAYAREMSEELSIDVDPVTSARDAMKDMDIAACCTDAAHPVYDDPSWLNDHVFLVDCSPVEVEDRVVDEITNVVTTTNEPYRDRYVGDAVDQQEFRNNHGGLHDFRETDDVTLADVLQRDDLGARNEQVYYRNRSAGIQFAAVGDILHEKAERNEVGTTIPLDWFQQSVRD